MKELLPVLAAGGTFAVTAIVGLVAGIWIGGTTHQPLWALAGLFAGLAIGGYGAFRLLKRSM